ncbi:MAG: hypothetical protein AMS22_03090 [Thiotrichales bacterium SG8_50]|nr:MAG: hypothetical protein AMS22_03090 [Thiotrichales bacterium SG8_50]
MFAPSILQRGRRHPNDASWLRSLMGLAPTAAQSGAYLFLVDTRTSHHSARRCPLTIVISQQVLQDQIVELQCLGGIVKRVAIFACVAVHGFAQVVARRRGAAAQRRQHEKQIEDAGVATLHHCGPLPLPIVAIAPGFTWHQEAYSYGYDVSDMMGETQ